MLGSFPSELLVVYTQPVYSVGGSRRCHIISLLAGCRVDLPVHAVPFTKRNITLQLHAALNSNKNTYIQTTNLNQPSQKSLQA